MNALLRPVLSGLLLLGLPSFGETRVQGLVDNNPTWSATGNPYVLEGDVTVPEGKTLTLQSGVVIRAGDTDAQSSGLDPTKVELIVKGQLVVNASKDKPVILESEHGVPGSWYGVVIEPTSSQTLISGALIQHAFRAVTAFAAFEMKGSVLKDAADTCLLQLKGQAQVSTSEFHRCGDDAIYVDAPGALKLFRGLLTNTGTDRAALRLFGQGVVEHSTLTQNGFGGIEVGSAGESKITNSIIAFNGSMGVRRTGVGPVIFQANNTFGHSGKNLEGVEGTGLLSADPQFRGPADFRLKAQSPCIGKGLTGGDLGAISLLGNVDRIVLNQSRVSRVIKERFTFTAEAYDEDSELIEVPFEWKVNPEAGSLEFSANRKQITFTAGCKLGEFQDALTVVAGPRSEKVAVTVLLGEAKTLPVAPPPKLTAGGTHAFVAKALDSCNNPVPGAVVSWSVGAGQASIDASGLFTAPTRAGTYTVTATTPGVRPTQVSVTVTPGDADKVTPSATALDLKPEEKRKLTATVVDTFGNEIKDAVVTWKVLKPEAGTIAADGTFTAGRTVGTFPDVIEASIDGLVRAKASVSIQPGPAKDIDLNAYEVELAPKGVTEFQAKVKDAFGNVTRDTVTWSVVVPNAGTLAPDGKFTATQVKGVYRDAVKATVGSLSRFASINVKAGALAHLTMMPKKFSVAVGHSQQLTVVAKDEFENEVVFLPVFTLVRGGGKVSSASVFTADNKAGLFEISVMAPGGVTAVSTAEVTAGPVARMQVSPSDAEVVSRTHQIFTLEAFDAFDNKVEAPEVVWNVDFAAGEITHQGVFTAGKTPGFYERAVSVSLEDLTAYANIRVLEVNLPKRERPGSSPTGLGCIQAGHGSLMPLLLVAWTCVVWNRRRARSSVR